MYFFYLIEQHSKFLLQTLQVLHMCTICDSTGLFEMIVGVSINLSGKKTLEMRADVCRITRGARIQHL